MGLCVISLSISLVMIERIYTLCLIIIMKSEVWTIIHCLGLGHEVQVQVQVQITLLLYETSNSLQLQNALHMEHNTELRFIQHSSTKQ